MAISSASAWLTSPTTLPSSNTETDVDPLSPTVGAPSGVIPRDTRSLGRWTVGGVEVTTYSGRDGKRFKEEGREEGREKGRRIEG